MSKTYICEFCLGRDLIRRELGYSTHVFLLNIPRLEFAALVLKGEANLTLAKKAPSTTDAPARGHEIDH